MRYEDKRNMENDIPTKIRYNVEPNVTNSQILNSQLS